MRTRQVGVAVASLALAAMPLCIGCASSATGAERAACAPPGKPCGFCAFLSGKCAEPCPEVAKAPEPCKEAATPPCGGTQTGMTSADLPPDPVAGECYAKVYIPAQYKTETERLLVKEASERIEICPAEYKWEEERVLVKEASKQLVEVPAEYKWEEHTVCVKPAHTGWVMEKKTRCAGDTKPRDVFCLVSTPAEYKTIRTQVLAKPACVKEEIIPAQYDTVRRQVVATPASTRRITIPAEYTETERKVLVCEATVKWEHIVCEEKVTADTVNKVKAALSAAGYTPGPMNGELTVADWNALTEFQKNNRLGVGELSYATLAKLGVSIE